ncbi:MAG: hypothetical protein B6D44_04250 [Ignavibacteriales bacterium UTCHB2]|jgi:hypothetical protein|nr:MAG: hypothetical protein B6D44_04250 [Ignavibacteriales bacterium UTCHB2]
MNETKEPKKIWETRIRYIYNEDLRIIKFIRKIAHNIFNSTIILFGLATVSVILKFIFDYDYFVLGAIPFSILITIILTIIISMIFYLPYLDTVNKLYNKGWSLILVRIIGITVQLSVNLILIFIIKSLPDFNLL